MTATKNVAGKVPGFTLLATDTFVSMRAWSFHPSRNGIELANAGQLTVNRGLVFTMSLEDSGPDVYKAGSR
jgi:hypothetical protein